jgi:hypothetical protein
VPSLSPDKREYKKVDLGKKVDEAGLKIRFTILPEKDRLSLPFMKSQRLIKKIG